MKSELKETNDEIFKMRGGGYPISIPKYFHPLVSWPWPGQDGVPQARTQWGTSWLGLEGDAPCQDWKGYPADQQSKYLLRDRRYASCVHAGRLSCYQKRMDHYYM